MWNMKVIMLNMMTNGFRRQWELTDYNHNYYNNYDLEYHDHDYNDHGHLLQGSGRHGEPAEGHSAKEEGSPSKLCPWILANNRLLECKAKSNATTRHLKKSQLISDFLRCYFETSEYSVAKHWRRPLHNENIALRFTGFSFSELSTF